MLMLFPTIKVPDLPHIEIYRDHKDPFCFYPMRSRPTIALDEDGNPQMSFNMFSRNADIAYASAENKDLVEAQLGQLLLTCDLSVTPDEHRTIVDYLAKTLAQERSSFNRLYYRFLKKKKKPNPPNFKNKIKLAYPDTWKSGTATFEILEGLGGTFKKSSSSEVKPSLSGSNAASFYATFGVEGAEVMIKALTDGYKEEGDAEEVTPLQGIVRYNLSGYAYVPNLEIKVTASNTQVHEYLQEYERDYRKEKRGYYKVTKKGRKKTTVDARSVTVDKSDISNLIEEMIDKKVINMSITDFSGVGADSEAVQEVENQIKNSVIDMVMGTMLPNFFDTAFIGEKEDLNEDGSPKSPGGISPDARSGVHADARRYPTVDTLYNFKNEIDRTKTTSLNFHFKKNGTVEMNKYPNGVIMADLTPEQRKNLIKRIDVSSPEVQIMNVQTRVNADFESGNIDSVIVNLKYKQKDHKTQIVRENSKSYTYTSSEQSNTFRVTMARNAQNELVDFYDMTAKIHYKNTSESPPEIMLEQISDRALVVSYDKLGFITVNCMAGDVDWDLVKDVIVDFKYLAKPDQPDTTKQIRLNPENPNGNWKCYMYGQKDKTYEYVVKYIYHDGREQTMPAMTATSDTRVIDDNLVGRMKASFDVIIDPNTVKNAKVEILYQDGEVKEEYSKWFENSETWDWSMRLREGGSQQFKYKTGVLYADGVSVESDWMDGQSDGDIPQISFRRHEKSLIIDGGLLDWTKYKIVYVTVEYKDDPNNYQAAKTFRFTSETMMETFTALAFDPTKDEFSYSLKLAGVDNTVTEVAAATSKAGVVLLQNPA